jgi:hypothetical protein
VVVVLVVVVV